MNQLLQLFEAVKEKNLTRDQLENYHQELTQMYAAIMVEIAGLKKDRPFFFDEYEKAHEKTSEVRIEREWQKSEKGQRLILLEAYVKATSKVLSSLKSRLFSIY